jgi:hypothetical protein
VANKDDDVGRKGRDKMLLQEGIQAISLYVRTPDLPASREGTHPARISSMRDTVTPIGSVNTDSKPTVRKAHITSREQEEPRSEGRQQIRQGKYITRRIGPSRRMEIPRPKTGQTWFWYLTQRTL